MIEWKTSSSKFNVFLEFGRHEIYQIPNWKKSLGCSHFSNKFSTFIRYKFVETLFLKDHPSHLALYFSFLSFRLFFFFFQLTVSWKMIVSCFKILLLHHTNPPGILIALFNNYSQPLLNRVAILYHAMYSWHGAIRPIRALQNPGKSTLITPWKLVMQCCVSRSLPVFGQIRG